LRVRCAVTEFELIERYFCPSTTHTVLPGGDDAALVAVAPGMELAVSTDMLVAGRHFLEDDDAASIGHKSLAVNLSDMAAMGATPRWATLALALPHAEEAWIARFADGFLDLARSFGVDLIGGDTTRGPLNICVQILGEVPAGQALRRGGARPGDEVWISGTLGDAALALAQRRGELSLPAAARDAALLRLDRPEPRVALGTALLGIASAAIDVSDGLVADLGHLARASGVRAVIGWEAVPLSAGGLPLRAHPSVQRCALSGGDDYELCFTAPASARRRIEAIADALALRVTHIGRVEAGSAVAVLDASGREMHLEQGGFDHFR
jgi:thiamine-monophosphate kinase